MEDIYSVYRYNGFKTRRKSKAFLIIVIVLLLSAAGIAALYFGGFTFKGKNGRTSKSGAVTTPELTVWTMEVRDIDTKTAAITNSLSVKQKGGAGYILNEDGKWTVVEGVYLSSADANREMMKENATEGAVTDKIIIPAKEISVPNAAAAAATDIVSQIKTTFETLVQKRAELAEEAITHDDIILTANNLYIELKNKNTEIANKNDELNDAVVANIIYAANQDILALYNLVYANKEANAFLSKLNYAIAAAIFSLTCL
jgi:hypothetical protein